MYSLVVKIITALFPQSYATIMQNGDTTKTGSQTFMCKTGKVLVFSTDMIFSIVSYTMHATD